MPSWIYSKELMEYFLFHINGFQNNFDVPLRKILKISEFFQNKSFVSKLIKDNIIPDLNKINSLEFLEESYSMLNRASENGGQIDTRWFDLFYKCIEIISQNFLFYLETENNKLIEKIKNFNQKILEEITEKALSYLMMHNMLFEDEILNDSRRDKNTLKNKNIIKIEQFEKLIEFLYFCKNTKNIYELLINEYLNISCEDNMKDLIEMPNPTFQVNLPYDIENYYNEFTLDLGINMKQIIFIIYYKKSDDSLNVSLKLVNTQNNYRDNFCMKIFTFLSSVKINNDNKRNQINVKSVSNNKSMHSIFKISNFMQIMKKNDFISFLNQDSHLSENHFRTNSHSDTFYQKEFFNIKINLKICSVHSIISSYLLKCFNEFYNVQGINKISKQLLQIILKNKYLKKENEDQVVQALVNWLKDEININEDVQDIIETIEWKNVSLRLMFDFILKHSKIIENSGVENIFYNAFYGKFSENKNAFQLNDFKSVSKF